MGDFDLEAMVEAAVREHEQTAGPRPPARKGTQRWRHRHDVFVPPKVVFDPSKYGVERVRKKGSRNTPGWRDNVLEQRRRRRNRRQADRDAQAMAKLVAEHAQSHPELPVRLAYRHLLVSGRKDVFGVFGERLMGAGGTRIVLEVPDDPTVVIKVGLPGDGSNFVEAANWQTAGPETRRGLVPVIDVAKDGSWLIMERVEPGEYGMDCEEDFDPLHELRDMGFSDLWGDNLDVDCRALDYAEIVEGIVGSPNVDLDALVERALAAQRRRRG